MNKDQKIAINKCEYSGDNYWSAHITPRQAKYLLSLGAIFSEHATKMIDYYLENGHNQCVWFSFKAVRQLKEMLEAANLTKNH